MMGPVTVTVTGSVAVSTVIVLDYLRYGQTAVQTVASSTATTYEIQVTLDTPVTISGSQATWFSLSTSSAGNQIQTFATPYRAMRLSVTTGTSQSQVAMTVIQSG